VEIVIVTIPYSCDAAHDAAVSTGQKPLHFGVLVERVAARVKQGVLIDTKRGNPMRIITIEGIWIIQELPCAPV